MGHALGHAPERPRAVQAAAAHDEEVGGRPGLDQRLHRRCGSGLHVAAAAPNLVDVDLLAAQRDDAV